MLLYAVAMQVFRALTLCRHDSQQLLLLVRSMWHAQRWRAFDAVMLIVLDGLWHRGVDQSAFIKADRLVKQPKT